MQIDLFNQALLLAIAFLTFVAMMYGFLKNNSIHPRPVKGRKKNKENHAWLHIGTVVIGSLLFGVALYGYVQTRFSQDSIPLEGIIWAAPLGATVILLAYNIRTLWVALACTGGSVCAVLLLLLLANNYYHYYPTLGAVLDQNQYSPAASGSGSNAQSNHKVFEQYYQAPETVEYGQLNKLTIPASGAFSPREGAIYLPPALQGNDIIKLPVVVLLAGYPGQPNDWIHAGIQQIMDDFATKHKGLAPIVAVVDFGGKDAVDTECVDSNLGAAETYLAKDVPEYLKAHYQVSGLSSDWTIGGYSAGGTCSSLVALRNPAVYRNYMNIDGATYPSLKTPTETLAVLFNNSQKLQNEHMPDYLLKNGGERYETMNAWYFIGEQDKPTMIQDMKTQVALANKVGIEARLTIVTGHHSFIIWKDGFIKGLSWMMNKLRFTVGEK